MKKTMIAATISAVAGIAYTNTAVAQAAGGAAEEAESLDFLFENEPVDAGTPTAAQAEPSPAPAVTEGESASSSDPAVSEDVRAEAVEELDVIPVSREQEQPAEQLPTPRRSRVVEEIVVTAQRREQSAQDVPISITVFDGKQLANANITNSADLALYTPSLSTNQRFGSDNATFSIRGFTQELRTTPSVATYMAEVVAPRGQSSQTSGDGAGPGVMFDLANVQVLKGPQGTLFGRNTTGGAVLLVPNRPENEHAGYFEVSGGEWGMRRVQGVVNVPFTDSFKMRLAVDKNERDGHLNNIAKIGSNELGSADYISARLSAVWDIADDIENYTILSYIDSESTGYSSQLYACNPSTVGNGFFLLFAGLLQSAPCRDQLDRQAAAGQNGFYDIVSTIKTPITAIEEKRLINTLSWAITEDITLKNILAYAHLHTLNGSDIFGTQFPGFRLGGIQLDPNPNREFKTGVSVPNPNFPVTSQETYVAEVQLQGTSLEGALEWQGGVYFENSRPDGFSGNNSAGLISCDVATLEGDPSGFNCFDPLMGAAGSVLEQAYKTEYLNRAVYSQITWHLHDQWSMTGGLRYTWDRAEAYGIKTRHTWALNVPLAPTETIVTPYVSSKAPTGLIELDYKPFEGQLIYAKYLRGYRQGNVVPAADPGVDTFEPERVDTYELGLKTQFGGWVPGRFNLAVFYNDFQDQQLQLGYISAPSTQTTTIVNAGKSRIQGIEGEAFFQVLDSVTLALSFSLLDTELLEQEDLTSRVADAGGFLGGLSVTPIAEVGDELPYAPKQTYVASLSWALPLPTSLGAFDLGISYSSIGKQRSAASSSGPFGMLDGFELLNLNLNWSGIFNTPLDLAVFGTNVLNEEYVTYTSGTYNLLGYESRQLGMPRTVGARLRYSFGAQGQ